MSKNNKPQGLNTAFRDFFNSLDADKKPIVEKKAEQVAPQETVDTPSEAVPTQTATADVPKTPRRSNNKSK